MEGLGIQRLRKPGDLVPRSRSYHLVRITVPSVPHCETASDSNLFRYPGSDHNSVNLPFPLPPSDDPLSQSLRELLHGGSPAQHPGNPYDEAIVPLK